MRTTILTRPVVLVAALAIVAVLALAACGNSSDADAGSGASPGASASASAGGSTATTDRISIENFSFTPSTTTVAAGTTVTWTNDSAVHDVTSTDGPGTDAATTSTFASEQLAQGDTFSYTFDEPGTYYYECSIHASLATMHAVVIVE